MFISGLFSTFKKIVLVPVVLLFCCVILIKCGGSTESSDNPDNTNTSDAVIGDRTDYDSVTLTSSDPISLSSSDTLQYYEIISSSSDENALDVSAGGSLTIKNSKVIKSGDSSNGENSGFYGFNSGVRATSSSSDSAYVDTGIAAEISMTDCTIKTNASGANGVFSFGQDAVINLDYVTIATTGSGNSGGIDVTYGGTINISNSVLSTTGQSSAALRSDRYQTYNQPVINADNVYATTSGGGSPGIYCTGVITVKNSTTIATGSEAACIEGLNSITLENTDITGSDKWGVIIYQSMSGDSSLGTGTFSMTGGTLTNNYSSGPMFFICNTDAVANLDGSILNNSSDMLLVAGTAASAGSVISNVSSDWGTDGGVVEFNASNMTLAGEIIICDSSSSIDLTLDNSTLTGAINTDNNGGTVNMTIGAGSIWNVPSGISYLSSLTNNGSITGSGHVFVNGLLYY